MITTAANIERLSAIAANLQQQAAETGEPARYDLPGGLTLTFVAQGEARQLSCTRWATMPSTTERELVRQAFGVPAWITYKDYDFEYRAGWGIMRIKWHQNRGQKLRKMAQAHLHRGWSQQRVADLLASHNLDDWNNADDAQLDALLAAVYGA